MKDTLKLSILTPEKGLYTGEVVDLITEGFDGFIEILPNHIPMVLMLKPTITKLRTVDGKSLSVFTSDGILKVEEDSIVIMCEAGEWPGDIDKARAEEAKNRAEKRLKDTKDVDVERAEMALLRALKRLKSTE